MRVGLFMATQWPGLGQGEVQKTLDRLGKIIAMVCLYSHTTKMSVIALWPEEKLRSR